MILLTSSAVCVSCGEGKTTKVARPSAKVFDTTYVIWGHDSTDYCIYQVYGKDTVIAGVESTPDYQERAEQRRKAERKFFLSSCHPPRINSLHPVLFIAPAAAFGGV